MTVTILWTAGTYRVINKHKHVYGIMTVNILWTAQ